jgi:hypothetical protein
MDECNSPNFALAGDCGCHPDDFSNERTPDGDFTQVEIFVVFCCFNVADFGDCAYPPFASYGSGSLCSQQPIARDD